MLIAGVFLMCLIGMCNIAYYEYRVMKGPDIPKTFNFLGERGVLRGE